VEEVEEVEEVEKGPGEAWAAVVQVDMCEGGAIS
jgi:hypothetical protein